MSHIAKLKELNQIIQDVIGSFDREPFYKKKLSHILKDEDPCDYKVIAIGKNAYEQVETLRSIWPIKNAELTPTLVIAPFLKEMEKVVAKKSCHPDFTDESIESWEVALKFMRDHDETRLILLISGGSSALIENPLPLIEREVFKEIWDFLIQSGWEIFDVNTIRMALSLVKNGGLVHQSLSTKILTFIESDIPSEDYLSVGSRPFLYQEQSRENLLVLVEKMPTKFKKKLRFIINSNEWNRFNEEKRISLNSREITTRCVLNQKDVLSVLGNSLRKSFPKSTIKFFDIEVKENYKESLRIVENYIFQCIEEEKPFILISGGELPVNLAAARYGYGGRNSHFVLALSKELFGSEKLSIEQKRRISVHSFATDGADGNSQNAGGWFNFKEYLDLDKSEEIIEDYLFRFDSATLLEKLGLSFPKRFTGLNFMDFRVITYKL